MVIHPVIRALINRRYFLGLTQRDVAKRLGTTQSHVSDIETGGNPNLDTLVRYADVVEREITLCERGMS